MIIAIRSTVSAVAATGDKAMATKKKDNSKKKGKPLTARTAVGNRGKRTDNALERMLAGKSPKPKKKK